MRNKKRRLRVKFTGPHIYEAIMVGGTIRKEKKGAGSFGLLCEESGTRQGHNGD